LANSCQLLGVEVRRLPPSHGAFRRCQQAVDEAWRWYNDALMQFMRETGVA
jgi:hypothetical protein